MKNLSIRFRMTFWYTLAMVLVALLAGGTVIFMGDAVVQKGIRDNLIETVEHNRDEIEYLTDLDPVWDATDTRHVALAYGEGYLVVDDDFLDAVNQVYSSLYTDSGELLYGENPISRASASVPFQNARLHTLEVEGITYYVFDRTFSTEGMTGLWLRGIVSEEQGTAQTQSVVRYVLFLLPILVLAASVGGYLLSRRLLRPVENFIQTANRIEGSNDLARRIEIGAGGDELHRLAQGFNRMLDRLEKSLVAERQFISDASHELRTPVAVIAAQCEDSLSSPQTEAEYRDALEVVARQNKKMARLIEQMLDFLRLETHAERYPRERVDFSALLTDLVWDMSLIREKGIELTWQIADGIAVPGNRELLSRMASNLITNAYRYGKEGGHTHLTLERVGEWIHLTVTDDGVGIAPEEQDKIFHRFYQAESSRSGKGLGLGLSMALEIARFHGGTITVESTPGVGSSFRVELPEKKSEH